MDRTTSQSVSPAGEACKDCSAHAIPISGKGLSAAIGVLVQSGKHAKIILPMQPQYLKGLSAELEPELSLSILTCSLNPA